MLQEVTKPVVKFMGFYIKALFEDYIKIKFNVRQIFSNNWQQAYSSVYFRNQQKSWDSRMRANYYATLRQAVGKKTEIIDLKGSQTLGNLLNMIVESHPSLTNELQDADGELHGHIRIFVNGEDVSYQKNISELALGKEDNIDIFPAIGGGSQATAYRSIVMVRGSSTRPSVIFSPFSSITSARSDP